MRTCSTWVGAILNSRETRRDERRAFDEAGRLLRFVGLDAKGRIWFGEWWNNKLGVLDPEGSQTLASR